ncbi:putative elongator complex protein 1 [Neurospora sp. IMI 360204]|nr:putative elongator complex protein 1 [Neurospora sp. IMI 360204]
MRNLRNIGHGAYKPGQEQPLPSRSISASCWDVSRDEIILAHGPTQDFPRVELVRLVKDSSESSNLEARPVASWDAALRPDGEPDTIRSMHYFPDTLTTCVIMAGGDIITVTESEGDDYGGSEGEAHVEIVGTLEPSVAGARWSPDEELLIVATGDAKVLFMSRTFDVITSATMTEDDLKLSKHVSVGWGKKETQFQGRGAKAKALRDPTIPEKVDEGRLSSNDDGQRCSISWRGDGAYVAVNFFSQESGGRRVIRVYNRDGELDSVSEPVDGLEGSLSWRPEGNLMAGIQRFSGSGRVDVAFFERNGLRHGQFTLQIPQDQPEAAEDLALEWNSDSTVLAVIMRDRVQLYTMGNYHWYLKQELPLCAADYAQLAAAEQQSSQARAAESRWTLPWFSWHAEKPLLFAVAAPERAVWFEFILAIARGPMCGGMGDVAVVDGRTIKFTPFQTANVPPPMALYDIEVDYPVTDIAFSKDASQMAVLHQKGMHLFALEKQGPSGRRAAPKLLKTIPLDNFENKCQLQIAVSAPFQVQVLSLDDFQLQITGWDFNEELMLGEVGVGLQAVTLTSADETSVEDGTVVQDRQGNITRVSVETGETVLGKFPTLLPWATYTTYEDQFIAFGLSRNGHLYANSRQLVKNCTSFVVTDKHLIYTTSNHFVKFIHLTANVDELDVPLDDPETDERCRSIERGGRLVTAMPSRMSIVLQMPRGNLETIYPRAMVLAGIRQLVEQKEYGAAFATCRTQRVDMNLLYDHRPEQFLENVGLFLDQVKNAADIDLFLSTLKEEDVTQTMYRNTKAGVVTATTQPALTTAPKTSKINTICDAVLHSLKAKKNANLQNIITAHVCKNLPALSDGLQVVASLMEEDEALAERAVEHICFLVDINKLYDHALSLYNLELTLLVAQQSQRDPREYLPFIQSLHKMDPLRRQFTIDDHLSHHEKALTHLRLIANTYSEEVEAYIIKHQLYPSALALYRNEPISLRTITALYAAHLRSLSKFRDAGLAYESLGDYPAATECYLKAGTSSWRECLFTSSLDPSLSSDQRQEIASSLADALREAKDWAAVATIQAEHLSSLPSAISALCKGYLFADAFRLISLHSRPELLESHLDPGLLDAFSSSTEFLADCKSQLKAQVPRIAELRLKAAEDPLAFYEGENPFGQRTGGGAAGDIPDDISVAASSRVSTSASLFTRYTGKGSQVTGTVASNVSRATSKNRKREEKKRARGRKGTVYEEEYLVNSVRRLVERVEGSARQEVERLVCALVRRGMSERARAVEGLMMEVVEGCERAVGEVWPQQQGRQQQQQEGEAGGDGQQWEGADWRPTGGDAVLADSIEAMRRGVGKPVVKKFERLSLLGGR